MPCGKWVLYWTVQLHMDYVNPHLFFSCHKLILLGGHCFPSPLVKADVLLASQFYLMLLLLCFSHIKIFLVLYIYSALSFLVTWLTFLAVFSSSPTHSWDSAQVSKLSALNTSIFCCVYPQILAEFLFSSIDNIRIYLGKVYLLWCLQCSILLNTFLRWTIEC